MTDAETIASVLTPASFGLLPLLIKIVMEISDPASSVMDDPKRVEALETSRRTLALSEECASRVTEIERSLVADGDAPDAGRFSITTSTGD
jgi:hypothetical protein